MKPLSKLAGLVHLLAVAWLLLSGQLLSWSPWAIVPQLLALALAVWARRSFPAGQFSVHAEPKEPRLVDAGPYRWIRHPMYAATQTLIWSGVLQHRTPLNFALAGVTLAAVIVRLVDEEALLAANVPGYPEYAKRTKRFVPFVF